MNTPADELWDAIVVGTGVGGATFGWELARRGRRVLFCELGPARPQPLAGDYPELADGRRGAPLGESAGDAAVLARAGRCTDALVDRSAAAERAFVPFIGAGPGGSSALYGMAMERFMPHDFEPWSGPGATPGWPLGYDELAPWYARAEALYRVRGEADPLRAGAAPALMPAPALTPGGADLAGFLRTRGLHPYRLPTACEFVAGCTACQGVLCPHPCKNGADRVCLAPALQQHGAVLLSGCRVLAVHTEGRRATGVVAQVDGREVRLRGRVVALAAGALQTPLILRRSAGPRAQQGLANTSGLVGRGLMRHLVDLYLVRPQLAPGEALDNAVKELAFNDFYARPDARLGTVQSFGKLPPPAMLFGSLRDDVRHSPWRWSASLLGLARPLMQPVLHDLAERWTALASVAEDPPDDDNAVEPHPDGPHRAQLRYVPGPAARERIARFRREMAAVLRGRRWRLVRQAENNQRIAHACGTCRSGRDPRTSVVDRDLRLHDLDNVWVVDSSSFPTSGGTNPSLTIAAQAWRVACRVEETL